MAARKAAPDAQPPRLSRGFTLIEIAIGLGILALVLGALLPMITAQAASARINVTRSREDAIRLALITYVGRHGYLPCPADGYLGPAAGLYGREARGATAGPLAGACDQLSAGKTPATSVLYDTSAANFAIPNVSIYRGVLPWFDLGLPEENVNDGWNQRITYVVSSLATTGYASREAISGMLGGLVVCSASGAGGVLLDPANGAVNNLCTAPSGTQPLISTHSAAAALISHGENGYGAFIPPQGAATATAGVKPWQGGLASANETANIDLTQNVLVQAGYSRTFDDIVLWLTPADFTAPLIQSGALPPAQALLNQRFTAASQEVLAVMNASRHVVQATSSPGSTWEYVLCLPMLDASMQGVFGDNFSQTVGGQLNPAVLPAGSATVANPASGWLFSYQGANDIASGGNARDPAMAYAPNYDPWGNPLLFSFGLKANGAASQSTIVTAAQPDPAVTGQPYAYLLYSLGPDGLPGTDDDASYGVTVGALRASLNPSGTPMASSTFVPATIPCP